MGRNHDLGLYVGAQSLQVTNQTSQEDQPWGIDQGSAKRVELAFLSQHPCTPTSQGLTVMKKQRWAPFSRPQ